MPGQRLVNCMIIPCQPPTMHLSQHSTTDLETTLKPLFKGLLLLLCITAFAHAVIATERASDELSHVVLVGLKEPGNQQAVEQITKVSQKFPVYYP